MTLKQLEYFLAIAENGSITKAAQSLRVSQPPLSLQLKSLEEELGCLLFIRDKKNMVITKKGQILQEHAREIMDKVNETILVLQTAKEDYHVTIHIGTISSISNRVLPSKILQLKETFPHLDFALHEDSTTSILSMLENGEVDFGIVREPFNVSNFHSRQIRDTALEDGSEDCFVAIGLPSFFDSSEDEIVPLPTLRDKPIIVHRRYNELFTDACRQAGFAPNVICQNDNISSSLSWAASGIGIAIAPYTSAIQNTDPNLILRRIDRPSIVSRAYLIWSKSLNLTNEQKAFVQLFN